jgi:hypothetical protein
MALETAPGRTTTRLVQLQSGSVRRVARVDEPSLRVLADTPSVVALANEAIRRRVPLTKLVDERVSSDVLDYDAIYSAASPWRLLVPIDHPEPSRCLVSGTGLTHYGSAASRDRMHAHASETERGEGAPAPRQELGASRAASRDASEAGIPGDRGPRIKNETERGGGELTDSMRMFRMGLDGGRPERGKCGVAPEWFYKGNATVLRASGDVLCVPGYAEDGGEEAEVAGIYLIDAGGRPWRIGMAAGNEFSDHKFEKRNYLNLAGSKLRTCALGPEIVIDPDFQQVPGRVSIERSGRSIWQRDIATGEQEMCHSVANIEHHHFKFEGHRRPGDVHVHFFGAHSLSFADGIQLEEGDVMSIQFAGFGRALRNPVSIAAPVNEPVTVQPMA